MIKLIQDKVLSFEFGRCFPLRYGFDALSRYGLEKIKIEEKRTLIPTSLVSWPRQSNSKLCQTRKLKENKAPAAE